MTPQKTQKNPNYNQAKKSLYFKSIWQECIVELCNYKDENKILETNIKPWNFDIWKYAFITD